MLIQPHVPGFKLFPAVNGPGDIPHAARLNESRYIHPMYAIIETGGKQYRVSEGDILFIEKLEAEADQQVTFDKVFAVGKEGETVIGSPTVAGAKVTAKVVKNGKSKKITVFTYRPKKGSKRKMGHRQPYTKVQIESITA